MKLHEALKKSLFGCGLLEDECQQIFDMYRADLENSDRYMYDRIMTSETTDYPPLLSRLLFLNCAPFALAWIDLNKPNHWVRSVFVELAGKKTDSP